MPQLITYLTFNGNCREAMTFYQECLGGELYVQTVGDSPLSTELPLRMRKYVLHAMLRADNLVLMATDMVDEVELVRGNSVSIMIRCSSQDEMHKHFENLSRGGKTTYPIEENFWGALFGGLTDKYGNKWLLHLDKTNLFNKYQHHENP